MQQERGLDPQVLRDAVDAAVLAGQTLRDAFFSPGGPEGEVAHCPADQTAESQIRAYLTERYPAWEFFGEEGGSSGPSSEYHWLVDPNDGTIHFQRGFGGSAVSVALLRGSELVLGVVYVPITSTGGEDLITWAEGQAIHRNGKVIERVWREHYDAETLLLMSRSASRRPEWVARAIDPARFLGISSIAYRLALVAVGEGDLAISLAPTKDYDFAAGHALVEAAGGRVVNAQGETPVYAREGGGVVRAGGVLIGGAPALINEIFKRSPRLAPPPRSRIRIPKSIQADRSLLRRSLGLFLGLATGDAFGAQAEFHTQKELLARFPEGLRSLDYPGVQGSLSGQITDDTELALALAYSLIEERRYDPEAVAKAYAQWRGSGPFAVGQTLNTVCRAGLQAMRGGSSALEAMRQAHNLESEANGALMRIAPLAIWHHDDLDQAIHDAVVDAEITHPNPVVLASNAAYIAALVRGLQGASPKTMHQAALEAAGARPDSEIVCERLEWAKEALPVLDDVNQGWVLLSLQNAFYQLLNASSFEEGIIDTVSRGGDTDTNAAIAGALLGTRDGVGAIPLAWRQRVLSCRPIAGTGQPRPELYWTDRLMELTEALTLKPPASSLRA